MNTRPTRRRKALRRFLAVALVFLGAGVLSSCSLLSVIFGHSDAQQATDRMAQIVAAVNDRDPEELKALFSTRAIEEATAFDEGMAYFLSFFPDGGLTSELDGYGTSGHLTGGQTTEMINASFKVSAHGEEFAVRFADFTVADTIGPENAGLYALGVSPWTEPDDPDEDGGFRYWAGSIHWDGDGEYGYPGFYVPRDDILYTDDQGDARMQQIADAVNRRDADALKGMFSPHALDEAPGFDGDLASLLAFFPNGGLTWEQLVVNSRGDSTRANLKLLTAEYRVSADGKDYWFFFADYAVNTADPESVGLASVGVSPWTEPGAPDLDEGFSALTDAWISRDGGDFGVYVPTSR